MATFPVNISPGSGAGPIQPQEFYAQQYVLSASSFLMPGPSEWPLTPAPPPLVPTTQWNQIPMLGKDQLPVGKQVFDLTGRPYRIEQTWVLNLVITAPTAAPFPPIDQPLPRVAYRNEQTWVWNQTPMLGMDQLPVGEQVSALPYTPPPYRIEQTWTWRQVDKLGQDRLPVGQQSYTLTSHRFIPPPIDQTWVWRQVGMLGKDQLPVGAQVFEDTLHRYVPYRIEQTWVWNQAPMIGQDVLPKNQFDWPVPRANYRLEQTTTWNQTPMLGRDVLPTGEQVYDLWVKPPQPISETWTWRQVIMLGKDTLPENQYDWPVPRAPSPPGQTWIWRQVGMLGQDQLPTGQQATDLPQRLPPQLVREWVQSVNLALTVTQQFPFVQTDWPLPRAQFRIDQTWAWSQVNMIGQDVLPNRQQDWPLTRPPKPIEQTWVWNQTFMLGQDQLPVGKFVYDLPVRGPKPIEGTWTWNQMPMLGRDVLPFRQQDWPLPTRQPITAQTWISATAALLSAQVPVTPLETAIQIRAAQPDRSYIFGMGTWMLPEPTALPAGVQIYDLPMRGLLPIQQPPYGPYSPAFIPPPAGVTLILRTLMGTGL